MSFKNLRMTITANLINRVSGMAIRFFFFNGWLVYCVSLAVIYTAMERMGESLYWPEADFKQSSAERERERERAKSKRKEE